MNQDFILFRHTVFEHRKASSFKAVAGEQDAGWCGCDDEDGDGDYEMVMNWTM